MAIFKERLAQLRQERSLSQEDVGEVLGITRFTVRYYETGERRPSFDMLIQLADLFDVSLDYLVGRTDKREVNR